MASTRVTARTTACTAALIAAGCTAGAARADVTAQEVWESWKDGITAFSASAEITAGSEEMAGDTLTVTDIEISGMSEGSSIEGALAELTFTETGDGSVEIGSSPEMTYTARETDAWGEETVMEFTLTQTGQQVTVSGTPEEMVYDFSAGRYAMRMDSMTMDGEPVEGDMLFALNELSGSYTQSGETLIDFIYSLEAGSVDILVDMTEPETEYSPSSTISYSGKLQNLSTEGTATVPTGEKIADEPGALFAEGLDVAFSYAYGPADFIFSADDTQSRTSGAVTLESGGLDFAMNGEAVSYDSDSTGIDATINLSQLPYPVEVAVAETGFSLELPLAATEEDAPFGLTMLLRELTLNDEVWDLFDPEASLPRDPATFRLGLSGSGKLDADLYDEERAEALNGADFPGELTALNLDTLELEAAGASVTGEGSFSFDNSDTTTFPGFPRPEGSIDLVMTGVNGLIDNLSEIGLLAREQLMGTRMMLGMFTTNAGDDRLTSTIEVDGTGKVFANGQRLQ
ncbi:DUF2125 domain-containing protein [Pseudoroseicyclus aestuarii]|uniref:Uncharacterized protein DUF2125 n=1 Tax=Pseudoroseicyclus aestuarii TaxID=1795041 RepID=A0A318SQS0_9RHOB|nr:DUF2125 domain-containing protein [Pseudoroseicyclus aestuarii]PYE84271.1 uncharacterized protein DUF2125 [Pseudoroseicyclus aestuarii]